MTAGFVVHRWTGVEIKALREAKRLSIKDFAAELGISEGALGKWEARGEAAVPRAFNQQLFDTCLARVTDEERARLIVWREKGSMPRRVEPEAEPSVTEPVAWYEQPVVRVALARRDIAAVYRALQRAGTSQREIASMTGQSQSEVSEVLSGRRVLSYDLLERIMRGLGVPRGYMGLAYEEESAVLAYVAGAPWRRKAHP
jgi:transcriptional regulator with XRE-family HTH domain